jgi:hypothetical protein
LFARPDVLTGNKIFVKFYVNKLIIASHKTVKNSKKVKILPLHDICHCHSYFSCCLSLPAGAFYELTKKSWCDRPSLLQLLYQHLETVALCKVSTFEGGFEILDLI